MTYRKTARRTYFGEFYEDAKKLNIPMLYGMTGCIDLTSSPQGTAAIKRYNEFAHQWNTIEHLPRSEYNDHIWHEYQQTPVKEKMLGVQDTHSFGKAHYYLALCAGDFSVCIMYRGMVPFRRPLDFNKVKNVSLHYSNLGNAVTSLDMWNLAMALKYKGAV